MTPLVLALALAADASAGTAYTVEPSRSAVRYHVVHKFHAVTGASSAIEGKAVVAPDGRIMAMVRVPLASFDSGDRNRDENMRDAVGAGRHPFVVFKGVARLAGWTPAAILPVREEARMEGEVELNGVKRPVTAALTVELLPDGTARARGTFAVSLEAFGVERPSLLFVKIDDACRIEVDLALRRGPT
ncbi:MAG TPA: YceI family protein [Anaeromyxobacteraceae bacterium]|nr:YceI family protein [Anaeromyxobacteraceae bacterium]